jgi:hypothetical protein
MRGSSLIPLLKDVIDCEIDTKKSPLVQAKLDSQGIKPGMGLRQGMPLSPILSNLLLSNFDRGIQRSGVEMIRYADDLDLFSRTKEEAHKGKELVARLLGELKLTIPKIGSPKTQVVGPDDPLHFLGREIVRTASDKYVAQISRLQIAKITEYLENEYSLRNCYKLDFNFQKLLTALSASLAAYRGVYRDAWNFMVLDTELIAANRKVISNIFADLFGEEILKSLDDHEKRFLGLPRK